jgi:hypothetical protein
VNDIYVDMYVDGVGRTVQYGEVNEWTTMMGLEVIASFTSRT